MRFWLGTHRPYWLWRTDIDLCVSDRTLRERVSDFPSATCDWILDSGAFSELQQHGRWTFGPQEYVDRVRRYSEQVGRLVWASPQDWMCEPWVIEGGQHGPLTFAGTGLDVETHQRLTVDNYLALRQLAPDLPFVPVLQGWERPDYERCLTLYDEAGVDLAAEPIVGLGSVCRRQRTSEIEALAVWLKSLGISLHGFGIKITGLGSYGWALASADSMAWSYDGRMTGPLDECDHQSCQNCLRFAMQWREKVLRRLDSQQLAWVM